MGGSGVGKSVMLKMLIGLLKPDAGSIVFDGEEVTTMGEDELSEVRQRIAMLFQSGALFDSLSVGENVAYGLEEHFRHKMSKEESPNAWRGRSAWSICPASRRCGPRICQAACASASRWPAPSPSSPRCCCTTNRRRVSTRSTPRGSTISSWGCSSALSITSIVVTHDMKSAFTISDKVAMVHSGRIIAYGTVEEFRAAPDPRVADFIEGRAPVKEDVETLLNA